MGGSSGWGSGGLYSVVGLMSGSSGCGKVGYVQ